MQYGLPVSDALVAAATTALQSKGVSFEDIYVKYLDLARNFDPQRRVALAALLRDKCAKRTLGLVIVLNQAGLELIAHEGHALVPPDVPAPLSLVQNTQVKRGATPRSIVNVVGQPDMAGTLLYGLVLFPRTQRVVMVTGAGDERVFEPAVEAPATMPNKPELEDTRALSHDGMLQRSLSLPADSGILMESYFKDRTERSFVPIEVVAEVAKRAHAPVFSPYDPHIRKGLTCGSVLVTATLGRRLGEIGFDHLTGVFKPAAALATAGGRPGQTARNAPWRGSGARIGR